METVHAEEINTLSQMELAYRTAEAIPEFIGFKDANLRWLYINACGLKMMQLDKEDVLGRTVPEILANHPRLQELFEQCESSDVKALELGKSYMEHEVIRFSDGSNLVFRLVKVPEKLQEDQQPGVAILASDITDDYLANKRMQSLLKELDHRVKNNLAVVEAMVNRTLSEASDLEAAQVAVRGRMNAIKQAHQLLARHRWLGADLHELVQILLKPFISEEAGEHNIQLQGAPVVLNPNIVPVFSAALHELATNAVKHGSLSSSTGKVLLQWHQHDNQTLHLTWQEVGGPAAKQPETTGYGLNLVQQGLAYQLQANVNMTFADEGLNVNILIPLADKTAESYGA